MKDRKKAGKVSVWELEPVARLPACLAMELLTSQLYIKAFAAKPSVAYGILCTLTPDFYKPTSPISSSCNKQMKVTKETCAWVIVLLSVYLYSVCFNLEGFFDLFDLIADI